MVRGLITSVFLLLSSVAHGQILAGILNPSSAQVCASFIGTPGTAISSYTEPCSGTTFVLYTADGTTQTIPLIDPTSGLTTINSGGGTTVFGDVLSTRVPTSADYTTSMTCTYTNTGGTSGNAGLFVRASNAANTQYFLGANPATNSITLFSIVAGAACKLELESAYNLGAEMQPIALA